MKHINLTKKIIFSLSLLISSSISFAQKAPLQISTVKNHSIQTINVTNSSLLMPESPLGMALFVFMLIITLAFAITRLKNENILKVN